ncbi:uncharacterized protein VTP21DRAFT_8622 [Calcarisporiella thermophila]|uniref:uncharacterized protein n=1 Tax=Calcarisporiella thermophila TaxID=911321 RepID=UPI003741F22D
MGFSLKLPCPYCSERFYIPDRLKYHMGRKHGEKPSLSLQIICTPGYTEWVKKGGVQEMLKSQSSEMTQMQTPQQNPYLGYQQPAAAMVYPPAQQVVGNPATYVQFPAGVAFQSVQPGQQQQQQQQQHPQFAYAIYQQPMSFSASNLTSPPTAPQNPISTQKETNDQRKSWWHSP